MKALIILLMVSGLFFMTAASIGILRLPDFYTRLHPAGKLDSVGLFFSLLSLALYNCYIDGLSLLPVLLSLKILVVLVIAFFLSPTAIHAIVDAGIRAGLAPWTKGQPRR